MSELPLVVARGINPSEMSIKERIQHSQQKIKVLEDKQIHLESMLQNARKNKMSDVPILNNLMRNQKEINRLSLILKNLKQQDNVDDLERLEHLSARMANRVLYEPNPNARPFIPRYQGKSKNRKSRRSKPKNCKSKRSKSKQGKSKRCKSKLSKSKHGKSKSRSCYYGITGGDRSAHPSRHLGITGGDRSAHPSRHLGITGGDRSAHPSRHLGITGGDRSAHPSKW